MITNGLSSLHSSSIALQPASPAARLKPVDADSSCHQRQYPCLATGLGCRLPAYTLRYRNIVIQLFLTVRSLCHFLGQYNMKMNIECYNSEFEHIIRSLKIWPSFNVGYFCLNLNLTSPAVHIVCFAILPLYILDASHYSWWWCLWNISWHFLSMLLQNSFPVWEDFNVKAGRLHSALRLIMMCSSVH